MARMRVVMLSNETVLVGGVEVLLKAAEGLEVQVISVDDPEAAHKVHELAPDVIILDSIDSSSPQTAVAQLLKQNPVARIVSLSLAQRDVEVFRMERLSVPSFEEFLAAIRSRSPDERDKGAELVQRHYAPGS